MSPYLKAGKKTYTLYVPTPSGAVKRSSGTRDKATARAMERMVQDLGPQGKRRWDLLGPVIEGRVSLAQLYDAYVARDLDGFLARLADLDLRPHLDGWESWARDRVNPATVERYRLYLDSLAPADGPWWRSTLTAEAAAEWLATRRRAPRTGKRGVPKEIPASAPPVSGPTKRKYAAALASFVAYARQLHLLDVDPLADITLPPARDPVPQFLEREEVVQLIDGAPEPYAGLFALLYGTGAEISAALGLRRRHVDVETWMIRVTGTKTGNRDRVAIVAEWARERVRQLTASLLPDAPLFPGIDRSAATKMHARILKEQHLRHMKLHASRNHWAVRAVRGGWSLEAVARQLGNTPEMVMRVYGRFVPSAEELARLEGNAEREAVRRMMQDAVGDDAARSPLRITGKGSMDV